MSSAGSNPFGDLPDPPRPLPTGPWAGEIVKAELSESGPPDPGERISILYLMVWTAGSAVILAFYRQSMSQTTGQESSPLNPPWMQTIWALQMSPLQGAGVGAVGLMVWRRFSGGRPFPRQPGHWLLVISGITSLLSWPIYIISHQLFQLGSASYLMFYRLPLMFAFYAVAAYAMAKMPGERRWRWMFLIWILANMVGLLAMCCFGTFIRTGYSSPISVMRLADLSIGVLVPLAFLITGILDKVSGAKRDPLHWAGVACRVAMIGQVGIEVVRMFLPRP